MNLIPIPFSAKKDLFLKLQDGIILCKLLLLADIDCGIHESMISYNDQSPQSNLNLAIQTAKALGITIKGLTVENF